jgi:hypothetical protein
MQQDAGAPKPKRAKKDPAAPKVAKSAYIFYTGGLLLH